jgi:hypothetical protein
MNHHKGFCLSALRWGLVPSLIFGLLACGLVSSQRPTANEFDAQLLTIMRERTRLWQLPRAEGGTREIDISALICPIVTAEKLSELQRVNAGNVEYVPDAQYPPGSQLWNIKGDVIDPMTVSMLGVWLGPKTRCEAQFRHTL